MRKRSARSRFEVFILLGDNAWILSQFTRTVTIYIYIYIYHHVVMPAWISLILSHHRSLSSIAPRRSSRLYPVSAQSCCIKDIATNVRPLLVHVNGSTGVYRLWICPYFSSSIPHVCSSNFDSFRDGWYVALPLLFCGILPPELVQYSAQHSCIVAVKHLLHTFS